MARKKTTPRKRAYHHGDLRRVLIDAATQLIRDSGLAALTMREVAREAGVSPAAPFRHFPTRTALLTAVAEEAMDRLTLSIDAALEATADPNPLARFRAIGFGFLTWVIGNPTHFEVLASRSAVDFEGSTLRHRNDLIRARMTELMSSAAAAGLLRPGDVGRHQIAGRALVYGLGRMYIDGQFPSWGLDEKSALKECTLVLDQFIASISA